MNLENVDYSCPSCTKPAKGKWPTATVKKNGPRPSLTLTCRHCGATLHRYEDRDSAPKYAYMLYEEWEERIRQGIL